MIAMLDPHLVLRLRDHYVNRKLAGIKGRSGFGHLRTRASDILTYDPDTGTYLPGAGQGDIQGATFWPPNDPKQVKEPNSDPAKDKEQRPDERMGGYAFSWPAYQDAALAGEESQLQNTSRLFGKLRPIRNLNLDTDKMYKMGRTIGFEDDPNPPVNGATFTPQGPSQPKNNPPPQQRPPTQGGINPALTGQPQPNGPSVSTSTVARMAMVAPPGGAVTSPQVQTVARGGSGSSIGGRISTTPRGGSTSGSPTPGRRFATFANYNGQKDLGTELPDNRMAASPLPGKWPATVVSGSEKDGQHPIVLPANLNLLISDYLSRNDFVEENIFSTRLADLKRDQENQIVIDKERIAAISSALRVAGVIDETGRSSALAWNVPPGVPFAGRGQFFDSGLLGSPFIQFSGGESTDDPDNKNQSTTGGNVVSRNKGRSGYNSNPSNVPSGILNNGNVGGGLAGLVAGAGGPNPVQPRGGNISGLTGFDGGNPTPCTTIDPGQSGTTCGTEGKENGSEGGAIRDIAIGYAGISGGGPISAGASIDRHNVGFDQDGRVHNQGHVHGFAPFHYGPEFCAPLMHEGEWEDAQDSMGVQLPVKFCHDSNKLHRIAGFRFGGGVAVGLQRWQVKVPFYIPPLEPPPLPPDDWFPPLWPEPKAGDVDPDSPPVGPEKQREWFQKTVVALGIDAGWIASPIPFPWSFRNSRPTRLMTSTPGGDFAGLHNRIKALEGQRSKNRGVATGLVRGRKLFKRRELVKKDCVANQRTYVRHWLENAFTSLLIAAPAPVNKDLKFERNPNQADLNAIEHMPISGRLVGWGAWINEKRPDLVKTLNEKNRYASGTPVGGGLNFSPGTEGADGRSGLSSNIGVPRAYFNFYKSRLSFGTINQTGDKRGTVSDGMDFLLRPDLGLSLNQLDNFGQEIEQFGFSKDGDFNATRDIVTGRTFANPIQTISPPGSTNALIGRTAIVQTSLGAGTIVLTDPGIGSDVGAWIIVKDGDGQASTNNITVSTENGRLINGLGSGTSLIVNQDRRSIKFQWDGSQWEIVADTEGSGGGSSSPDNFSYYRIPLAGVTVPVDQEMAVCSNPVIDGPLVIDGRVCVI